METKELAAVLRELKTLETSLYPKIQEQNVQIEKHGGTLSQLGSQIGKLEQKHDERTLELKEIQTELKKRLEQVEVMLNRPGFSSAPESRKDLGARFVESPEYKEWHTLNSGRQSKSAMSSTVEIGSTFEKKDLLDPGGSLRNIFAVEKVQQIFADPLRPNRVRDLFPVIPTQANVIEYVVETGYTRAAAPQVEGDQKPESQITFDDANQTVRTIAHWIPVNRQLLDDVQSLRAYLNLRLTEGLKEIEDTQLLYGDGTGVNLLGILQTPGIQTYTWSTGAVGDTKIDAVRKAITKAQLAYYPVTGIVLNPTDWQDIELVKSTQGLYVWVNVATGAEPSLWKVPVVPTSAITAGQALLGAFQMGAAIWDREAANVRVTDSHQDFFTRNRMVILVEERLTVTTFRPKSFVNILFDDAPAS